MKPRIVNLENVPWLRRSHGESFEAEIAPVGAALDSRKLRGDVPRPRRRGRGSDSEHPIVNDSSGPLRYLAGSTMELPDVSEYPDSGKLGVIADTQGGHPSSEESIRHFAFRKDGVNYWEGE
jgi:hypothetical protein